MAFRSLKTNADLDQKHGFFPCKFADLRFTVWHTTEICGITIAECAQRFADKHKNLRAHLW
jgi:hypothetical protein